MSLMLSTNKYVNFHSFSMSSIKEERREREREREEEGRREINASSKRKSEMAPRAKEARLLKISSPLWRPYNGDDDGGT